MAELLTPKDIEAGIVKLVSVNPLFAGKDLKVLIIANEKAGGFTQKKQSALNKKNLENALNAVESKSVVTASIESELIITEYSGHAEKLVRERLPEISEKDSEDSKLTLFVSAGGDGTSWEVQTGMFKAAQESEKIKNAVMNYVCVLRLPLGTGNDGTDGHVFEETLELLSCGLHFANARAVKVSVNAEPDEEQIAASGKNPCDYGDVSQKAPWLSFNIAGIGLDAFVCWKTNEEKTKHPGNHYQLMVDFATLNYNKAFPPEPAVIKIFNKGELLDTVDSAFEMLTFGVSGHRTFGGGKKIFPVNENVAVVRKLDVLTMALQNGKFTDGSYIKTDLAKTYSADKLVLEYASPVLVELDGETHLLLKENFPVTLELTEPLIQVLERDDLSWSRGTERK